MPASPSPLSSGAGVCPDCPVAGRKRSTKASGLMRARSRSASACASCCASAATATAACSSSSLNRMESIISIVSASRALSIVARTNRRGETLLSSIGGGGGCCCGSIVPSFAGSDEGPSTACSAKLTALRPESSSSSSSSSGSGSGSGCRTRIAAATASPAARTAAIACRPASGEGGRR